MAMESRRAALCAQTPRVLTGIDFVQVVDPNVQTVLRVFFIIEPDDVAPVLAAGPYPNAAANIAVELRTLHGDTAATVVAKLWRQVTLDTLDRVCLEIQVAEPGGFEPYRLTLTHLPGGGNPDQLDPFLSSVVFDFKQGCETGFDCEADQCCAPDPGVDFPVDYLARDFESFRRALLDFAAQRYPDWKEPIEADQAVMLMEIMAALGDEFAYLQDRYDTETRFGSATQRASRYALAQLVDYRPDPGAPASGEVAFTAVAGGTVAADAVLWAAGPTDDLVPFSLDADIWVHPFWNGLPLHNPNPEDSCLAKGQTSILLAAGDPGAGGTPPDPGNPGFDLSVPDFLIGRRAMLLSDPSDAAFPRHAWPVTITGADQFTDPLLLTAGNPTPVLRLHWADAEATPFDLQMDGLTVALNIGRVTAGGPVIDYARAGEDADIETYHGGLPGLVKSKLYGIQRLIEREGPYDAPTGTERSIVARHGLAATEASSLRFDGDGKPAITVEQIKEPAGFPVPLPSDPMEVLALFPPDPGAPAWTYFDDLLDADLDTTGFTLEPGMWRTVETHHLPLGDFPFRDYAVNGGWTLKFGFGDFGQPPADGALLRIRYHTDPGLAGNIASETLALSWPLGPVPDTKFAGLVSKATNPLPFANARAEESAASIRLNAPYAYRALPRRAVRPEDYSAIIERMPWVQKAHSVTRWTGSWPTDFVAVDPVDSVAITDDQRRALSVEIDCIRLMTRDARPVDPDYLDIDLEVRVCVGAGFYAGDVLKRVRDRLMPPGFFDPDNFTFGDPLRRAAIEAAVQDVPGVAHVDGFSIRIHGIGDWRDFSEAEIATDPDQIIRLQNDPDRSTLGLLRVEATGVM